MDESTIPTMEEYAESGLVKPATPDRLRQAFAGKLPAGHGVKYTDVFIVRSDHDSYLYDIYATTEDGVQWLNMTRIDKFVSLGHFEQFVVSHGDSETEERKTEGTEELPGYR